ncbi:unnamed protein product [Mytilus edulis]|uniref:Uncharacterized protein n=1 Tax=Mytilus edulis TaxID=6550 RepID=A0A8S3R7W6_MYTED|nr:unnamed protein product [Mytilus edulis]
MDYLINEIPKDAPEPICPIYNELDKVKDSITCAKPFMNSRQQTQWQNFFKDKEEEGQNRRVCNKTKTGGKIKGKLWTNNNSESMNNMLKSAVNWKPKRTPDLIDIIYNVVDLQYKDAKRSLYSSGNYRLTPKYCNYLIPELTWRQKSDSQQLCAFNNFIRDSKEKVSARKDCVSRLEINTSVCCPKNQDQLEETNNPSHEGYLQSENIDYLIVEPSKKSKGVFMKEVVLLAGPNSSLPKQSRKEKLHQNGHVMAAMIFEKDWEEEEVMASFYSAFSFLPQTIIQQQGEEINSLKAENVILKAENERLKKLYLASITEEEENATENSQTEDLEPKTQELENSSKRTQTQVIQKKKQLRNKNFSDESRQSNPEEDTIDEKLDEVLLNQPDVNPVHVLQSKEKAGGNSLRPGMFHSHEGRVADTTEENVCRAEEGLPFNLLFLQKTQDEVNESCNPTTGS